jgi:hypothetical protein
MPSTYEPIATTTLGSAASSITFSSIPSTYTDLVIVTSTQRDASGSGVVGWLAQFNGDTSTNYSVTAVLGNGSTAFSGRETNQTGIFVLTAQDSTWGNSIINIMNYSNATTNKTVLTRINTTTANVSAYVGLWRNTAAINSITISGAANIKAGSTFTLYGIKAA